MGALGGLLGLNGGQSGTGINGPSGAPIVNPTNADQIKNAYTGAQGSLDSQQALLRAIQAQNGLGNQSQVYGQLQNVAAGQGPNPAQAMLAQATGQNVANQAALMAGQRGAASNVGLMARQAAQVGSQAQMQSANQGAVLQANQSLNALNAAGQMANNQVSNQVGQTNANTQAQQAEQQSLMNAQLGVNNSNVGMQSNINTGNAALADRTMQGQQGMIGGILNGAGVAMKAFAGAEGGPVPQAQPVVSGAQSKFGQFLNSVSANQQAAGAQPQAGSAQLQNGASNMTSGLIQALASRSKAPQATAMAGGPDAQDFSGGVMRAASGGMSDYRTGGPVAAKAPSQKAVASGNSYANDKIPAVLSEHEIVIPRSVTMGKDPVNDSARFVASVLAKRGRK